MENVSLINNTSVYRNPAPQSPLQGEAVLQPAAVYSKIMLRTIELAESDYTFDGLATERSMPSNNGANEIVFKRMLSLAAHTQPLAEGIPPASDKGSMVAIKASANQYGRVMKFTDKVNWAVVDPLISEYTRQLSLKVPETKDLLAQEALLAECQMFYAQPKKVAAATEPDVLVPDASKAPVTHITMLTQDCAPTIDEFRKIVLSMEAAKVRPYQGSNFLALASSAVIFDLITDKRVKEFMKYENTAKAYTNDMVVDLFSLVFRKAKTIKSDNTFVDGDGNLCYLYTAPSVTFAYASAGNTPAHFSGTANYTGAINFVTTTPIEQISKSDTTQNIKVYYTESANGALVFEPTNGYDLMSASELFGGSPAVVSMYDALNIHHSLVVGEECLFRIGVEGHTAPEFITKPLGSAGTEDPLNQRQSIGWKIDSLGYKVPNPDAVVDYCSIPTQYKINMNQRPDLKNQFTDYDYGFVDANGKYYYPEQVIQTVVSGNVVHYVKGTAISVSPIKMTALVKPVNGGRIGADGTKARVVGTTPTMEYILASTVGTATPIRFMADQVVQHTDSKFYIKGLAGTSSAEVVALPSTFKTFDGEENVTSVDYGNPNK